MARRRLPITAQLFLLLIVVLSVNAGAYLFILQNVYEEELKSQAKTVVANVEAFGAWVSRSGRVWTKNSKQDFLSKETVISADDPGEPYHFFSKNPALATREFSEVVAQSPSPAKFRMTSHNVMNPANKPDPFEQRALEAIRSGQVAEYVESATGVFRYASPVIHKASCIKCHGDPANAPEDVLSIYGSENGFGFKEGDVAGVISVTIPKKTLLESTKSMLSVVEAAVIFLSIIPILWFVQRSVIVPVRRITYVAECISKGKDAEIDASKLSPDSRNEIDQLTLATSRMRSSFHIAMRKMKEARSAANKAVKYAQALKAKKE